MAIYSTAFAQYYDSFMGHDTTITDTIKDLVTTYAPQTKETQLLELGCGTGNVLQEMPTSYQLFGLDIAESMLGIAKKKLPQITFVHADMSKFQLSQKFHVIISVFDSINHLTTWRQWKSTFRCVHHHLNKDGVFIFDMNTTRRMALLASFKPYVAKINKDCAIFVKVQKKENIYVGQFVILDAITKKTPIAIEQIVEEAVFPVSDVKEALKKYFIIEKVIDPMRKQAGEDSGRLFFVCKKK